ncbi:MAG: trypsin-like serine protease [Cytophagales bacterium]|nr:trypsin-like serine protease [Cytophagales bacterium]
MKKSILIILLSASSAFVGAIVAIKWLDKSKNEEAQLTKAALTTDSFRSVSSIPTEVNFLPEGTEDFVLASAKSTSSVVFIQTTSEYEYRSGSWLDWFFDGQKSSQTSAGSGVILSEDGYIVTNNHVVEGADKIRVISGKRTYEAKLIGSDPSSDLAVIKIDEVNLVAIELGNSDEVNVGEWVLAVGNPFNLTSTVTAGIVSAKGRNINLLRDKFPIESFIQTDAAINPGNSGGALVNASGQLIGINTAILSRTGSYAGYGFAVPVNIVKKVFSDITKYGEIQKAYLGAEYLDIDSDISEKLDLDDLNGVLVSHVQKDGAAGKSGLKKGDIIRSIDGTMIESKATIEEIIGNKYPGDEIELVVRRKNNELSKSITLTNREGGTGILKKSIYTSEDLEATFEVVSKVEIDLYDIRSGVKVTSFERNGFFDQLDIPEGFIITQINNIPIDKPEELVEVMEQVKGRVRIYGVKKDGRKVYYPYYF